MKRCAITGCPWRAAIPGRHARGGQEWPPYERLRRDSFVLLEAMLGVAIFVIGVLALGQCIGNCLSAEIAKAEDLRARLALQNRMAQIESGETKVDVTKTEKLKGMFQGITMKQSRAPLAFKNEKNEDLTGLHNIELEASWVSNGEPQAKALSFYVLRQR